MHREEIGAVSRWPIWCWKAGTKVHAKVEKSWEAQVTFHVRYRKNYKNHTHDHVETWESVARLLENTASVSSRAR